MHKRLAFVDTLRGIAVLAVVLQHALEQIVLNQPTGSYYWAFHYALGEYFNFGRFGVVLFFFVSGFVIPYSFPNSAAPVRDFAVSRFFVSTRRTGCRSFFYWFSLPPLRENLSRCCMSRPMPPCFRCSWVFPTSGSLIGHSR